MTGKSVPGRSLSSVLSRIINFLYAVSASNGTGSLPRLYVVLSCKVFFLVKAL